MFWKRLVLFCIAIIGMFYLSGCGGSSKSPSVTVTATATTVDATDTVTLTATVANDKSTNGAADGVTWTLTGGGTLSNTTTTSATYTAPAATSSAQTVTVTAISAADTTQTKSVTLTIPAALTVTTTSAQLTGAVGTAYSVQLVTSAGISPYHWSVDSSTPLPANWNLSSSGLLTAPAPTNGETGGTYTFDVTDSGTLTPMTASQSLTVTITPAPAITFGTAPTATGTYNAAYSSSVSATGGAGTLHYSSTTLPSWLTLNASTGAIAGTPSTTAEVTTFNFTVTASDAFGDSANSPQYTLVVSYPAMNITTASLPTGYVSSVYATTTLAATGGTGISGNYAWALASGSNPLPAGLNLVAGQIVGTPTGSASGPTSINFQVTDTVAGISTTKALSITVKAGVSFTTSTTLPVGYVGSNYSQQLAATGGSGAGYSFAVANGSSLPDGLSLSASGLISGKPTGTTSGPASVNLTATDSAGNTVSTAFSITIDPGVSINVPAIPAGYPGTAYTATTLTASGGTGADYTWTWAPASGSSLPAGLSLASSSGQITGTPTNSTSSNVTSNIVVTATDSVGNVGTAAFSLTIEAALAISPTATMPTGVVGTPYSQALTATGGTGAGTYTWSLISGSGALSGLGLNFTGGSTATLAGTTPVTGGPASFTVQVEDADGHQMQATLSVTINATLAIQTSALSPDYVYTGSSYSQTLTAAGGAGPYTWSVASGSSLPSWLSLGSNTGILSGSVPSNATTGPASFTVQVEDAYHVTATQSYTLTVYGALALTPPSGALASVAPGQTYSGATITASGGSGSYSWAVSSALTASGLTATPSGSTLSFGGTAPATVQTIPFTVTLTDTATSQSYGPIQYTIAVSSPTPLALTPDPTPLPTGTVGQTYSGTITISGGSGTGYVLQVMVGGTLTTVPSAGNGQLAVANGITVAMQGTAELVIGGTPTAATPVALDVTVTDSAANTLTQDYTLTIVNPSAGHTVSGTVSYSGSLTGWVYLQLVSTGCTGCDGNLGTAINATTAGSLAGSGMAFTINGVPPGTYTLQAYMDNTSTDSTTGEVMGGYGAMNASNPAGVGGANVVVTSGPVTGANVTLASPTGVTLGTKTPTWDASQGFGVFSGGALVTFDPIVNSSGIEIPNSYIVQWSTSSSFGSVAGSQCFPATDAQQPWIVSGISGSGPYYFRAAGVLGSCHSGTAGTYSAASSSAYTIANPTTGYLISGTVSFSGTATGPLYVGFFDRSTGNIYATVVGSKSSPPASGASYSLHVPAGSNYYNFGVVDQKNDGLMVPGAISNVNEQLSTVTAISGAGSVGNLALPSGNGMANVRTNSNQQTDISGNTTTGYGLDLRVLGLAKQPASVELYSGPSYLQVIPADIATAAFNGNTDEWDYYPSLNGSTPSTSDVFTFNVTYTDGTSNSTANSTPNPLTGSPTGVLSAWVTNMSPDWETAGASTTPNFSWSYPAGASNYTYQFQLEDSNYKTIWSIPAQHSHSNGFASSVTPSLTWGVDPTGGGSTPSVSSLSSDTTYIWSITAYDSNNNQATTQMAFHTAASTLTLPASGPGNALVNTPYGATINASGGSGSGYVFTVNGTSVPTTGSGNAVSFTGADGLTVYSTGGNTLWISGTPTTAETVTLSVTVTDSLSDTASQTYTFNVVGAPSGANNANLKGTYVCKIDSFNDSDGARWASLSSLVANGSGGITSGVWDMNARDLSAAMGGTITSTSTYSVGADNNGILTMNTTQTVGGSGNHSSTFAIALNNAGTSGTVATEVRMVETDDVGATPSGQHGSGVCYLATTSAFAASTISGKSFAFGTQGEDHNGVPSANVGRYSAASGGITKGYYDGFKVSATADQSNSFTGTYTTPNSTTGRFTAQITQTISGTQVTMNYAEYIIDANRQFMLETDPISATTGGSLQSGDVRTQLQSSYSAANLTGSLVLYNQSYQYSSGSVSGNGAQLYLGTGDGAGNFTVIHSYEDYQGTYSVDQNNGTMAVTFDNSNPGRVTMNGMTAYLFFYNTNSAFEMSWDNNHGNYLDSGWLEPQSGTFTNAGLAGTYMIGKLPPLVANSDDSVGELAVASTGSVTANITSAGQGEFSWDQALSGMSYSWLSSTYGSYSLSGTGGGGTTCIVVSATKSVCIDNTSSSASMTILQQ